ncbi:GPO family capsid scaffolding protein [Salmonella enterica]|nr:GPO family capsid scaffolding protein [Salmonella enterica]
MPKTKFFRVAVEGATCDGRTLERQHLEQIAKNFDPLKFGARCNLEHIKSLYPDGTFKMYGDVLAVKAEEVKEGSLAGKLALYVQADVTDELVALNRKRQKVYTSIEVKPSFADTGEAYLVGLAFTDSPASLGTELLKFSATCAAELNPLAARKTSPDCFFTEALETSLDFDQQPQHEEGARFFSRIKEMLTGTQRQHSADIGKLQEAIELTAEGQGRLLDRVEELASKLASTGDSQVVQQLSEKVTSLTQQLTEMQQKLATQDGNFSQRPTAPGGNGNALLADC